jgi:oxygen-independent coproporphyrinogen-3 oxidase
MKNSAEPPGLYVHIPFCRTKCPYCGFFSIVDPARQERWREAVLREAAWFRERFSALCSPPFDTLYLGGGTPTALPSEMLAGLIAGLRAAFSFAAGAEFTTEANPGDFTPGLLEGLRTLGVNRLSVGVQAFDDATLQFLGRRHDARQALSTLDRIRQAGFAALGIDLIYGLRGQDWPQWRTTLERALTFTPEHLSCYQLTIEEGTPFEKRQNAGQALTLPEEGQAELFLRTSEFLEGHGYVHYEVSNFARGNAHRSRQNQKYWRQVPTLGLGPAAHSFDGRRRWWNPRSLDAYLAASDGGLPPEEAHEDLTDEQLRIEQIALGLRTREGVSLDALADGPDRDRELARAEREGLASVKDGRLEPTRRGLLVADRLALRLV